MDKYDYDYEIENNEKPKCNDDNIIEVDYNNFTHLYDRNYYKFNYENDRLDMYYVIRMTLEKHLKEKYRDIL